MNYSDKELKQLIVAELPRLRRFAISLTGNHADADDLIQTVVVKMLQKGVAREVKVTAWFFRVCKNVWLDEIRARDVRQKHIEDSKEPELEPNPVKHDDADFSMEQIVSAMEELPDEQRVIVSLVLVEGFGYAETADLLNVPVGTIMSRLSRARKKLVQLLSNQNSG